jgi:FtsZ-binding cell division protein ZapB
VLIDKILSADPPKDFDDFLKQLEKNGCKIKRRGKTISFRPPGAERFFRFKSGKKGLPDGYDEESLRKRIADLQTEVQTDLRGEFEPSTEKNNAAAHTDAERFDGFSFVMEDEIPPTADTPPAENAADPAERIGHDKKINLLIDIENSIKAQNSPGYERWAKGFNLQQAAETLLFLPMNNLTDMEDLTQAVNQAQAEYDALQKRIDAADRRIKEVNTLQKHIGAYRKNSDIYSQYLRSKRNPKFRADNENAIAAVEEAKAYFDLLGLDKLPTIKELQAEYSVLSQEKQTCYQARTEMRRHVLDLQSAKKNAEMLLGLETEPDNGRTKKKGLDDDR